MTHVLFISWWWPYPADNGSKIRIYNLLRQLAKQHQVSLLSFADEGEVTEERRAHLRTFCREVIAIPRTQPQPGRLQVVRGYLSRWPRSMVYRYSAEMTVAVERITTENTVDAIVASQVDTMRYLEAAPHIPAVLEEVEITIYHEQVLQAAELPTRLQGQMRLTKLQGALQSLMQRGVVVTVVSEKERDYLQQFAPPGVVIPVIPNGVDTQTNRPDKTEPQPYTLIYTGAVTYNPNYEAVAYFIREVWPLVRRRYPQAHFTVTGGTGSVDISDLARQPGVIFTGYLPEISDAVRASWAMVVPLLHGGGTRLKILESMALGTPVISTPKGAEGLDCTPGTDILIAAEPQAMADAVSDIFENAALRARLVTAGRVLVKNRYDWSVIGQSLLDIIAKLSKRPPYGN